MKLKQMEKEFKVLKELQDRLDKQAKLMWGSWFRGFIAGATGMAIISIIVLIRILVSCK